jgi:hypothetical protein
MNPITKITLGLVGGASAVMLYSMFNTANAADKFDFKIERFSQRKGIKLKSLLEDLLKLNFNKVLAHTDVVFDVAMSVQNPTNVDVQISHPYLKVFYNGTQIGNSTASGKTHMIKSKSVSHIDNIEVTLAGVSMFSVMPDYAKYLLNRFNGSKSARSIKVKTLLEVNGNSIQNDTEVKI